MLTALAAAAGAALLLLVLLVVLLVPYRFMPTRYRRLVARIPGPQPCLPVLGNAPLLLSVTRAGMVPLFRRLVKEHGPLFKLHILGITHVICSDPHELEKVLSSMQHITKSFDYLLLSPWLGNGLLLSTGNKWHSRRKLLTPAFHFRILEEYVPVFTRCSSVLVAKLRQRAADPHVPVNDVMTLCTLDIICETAMGTFIDAQNGQAADYVAAVKRMSELFQERQLSMWLWKPWAFALSATGREQRRVLAKLHGFTMQVIRERQQERRAAAGAAGRADDAPSGGGGRRRLLALLDLLLEVSERNPGSLSLEDIREEVDTFMFEGHDTTSAALSWAVHLLALHPAEQEKAAAEQAEIFGDSAREPTVQDLGRMRYLEQVIKESLRLFPSVPAFSRLLESDITVNGTTVPTGAFFTVPTYALHRNPAVFPEPDRFHPERFDPERADGRHPFAYLPFSAGPRSCIGQRFALLEEKAVLSALLRNFRMQALDDPEEVRPLMELVLRPEHALRVRFRERGTNSA